MRAPDGSIDIELTPTYVKPTDLNIGVMAMLVRQSFGSWRGTVRTDDGVTVAFDGIPGFAEECRAKW